MELYLVHINTLDTSEAAQVTWPALSGQTWNKKQQAGPSVEMESPGTHHVLSYRQVVRIQALEGGVNHRNGGGRQTSVCAVKDK